MTRLVAPDLSLHPGWAATLADFEGIGSTDGSGLWNLPQDEPLPTTEDGCRTVLAMLEDLGSPAGAERVGQVPCDYFWITDGDDPDDSGDDSVGEVIGFLALRHRLNDFLLEAAGHIGYSVRPARRREGHATRALALAVRRAAELGIERALVTCDSDNRASAATIEANGGVLEDERRGVRRYWIETAATLTRDGTGAAPS